MRPIVLISSPETQNWKFFLNHHGLPHQEIDYWEQSDALHNLQNSQLIINQNLLVHLYQYQQKDLVNIIQHNKVFVVGFCDAPVIFRDQKSTMDEIDRISIPGHLVCLLECDRFEHGLENIEIDFDPVSKFFDLTEQRISLRLEKTYNKDFLLCMGRSDPSRDTLWSKIKEISDHDSVMIYHRTNPSCDYEWKNYIGENSAPLLQQRSLVPSLDLYNSCCVEIVAESITYEIRWFTEKTIRPIAARTAFVLLGPPGHLESLHELGFKTFDSLIDESYDQEHDLDTRISKITQCLRDILSQGSVEFARAAQHITDHNWDRLAEIKGSFALDKDRRYLDLLSRD